MVRIDPGEVDYSIRASHQAARRRCPAHGAMVQFERILNTFSGSQEAIPSRDFGWIIDAA